MLNKAIIQGRLTKDPEIRYTANTNTTVVSFTLAINRFSKQEENKVDFINVVAWGGTAEHISKYFTKGQMAIIDGRIQTRNYDDKDGKKVYVTEVVAEQVYFADSKKQGSSDEQEPNVYEPFDDEPF